MVAETLQLLFERKAFGALPAEDRHVWEFDAHRQTGIGRERHMMAAIRAVRTHRVRSGSRPYAAHDVIGIVAEAHQSGRFERE